MLIYGAYGYSGLLVVAEACRRGLRPMLAGRDSQRTAAVATRFNLPWAAVRLDDSGGLDDVLANCDVVAHCAGPFEYTAAPMVEACLRTGTHYLDLTGEAEVFDAIYARHDDAVAAGVALVPGVGFDVVPTDHLVATLSQLLPSAVRADIAVVSNGGFSSGTLQTALHGIAQGNRVFRNSKIEPRPLCHRRLRIELPNGTTTMVASTPLGDLASAPRATPGLREVTTSTRVPAPSAVRILDVPIRMALRRRTVRRGLQRLIARVPGPSKAARENTRSVGWVRLSDNTGAQVNWAVEVPNTYAFTAASMVHAACELPNRGVMGALAPSSALGVDFITTIPDVDLTYLGKGLPSVITGTTARQ